MQVFHTISEDLPKWPNYEELNCVAKKTKKKPFAPLSCATD